MSNKKPTISIENLYCISKMISRAFPQVKDAKGKVSNCKRINSFIVISDEKELNDENLGATHCDKNGCRFWSRSWEQSKFKEGGAKLDFPALVILNRGINGKKDMFCSQKNCYTFDFVVIDQQGEEKGATCANCEGRNDLQIEQDTNDLLDTFINEIWGMCWATILLNDNTEITGWYNAADLEQAVADGEIQQFSPLAEMSDMIEKGDVNASTVFIPKGTNCWLGTRVEIRICFSKCVERPNMNYEPDTKGVYAPCESC